MRIDFLQPELLGQNGFRTDDSGFADESLNEHRFKSPDSRANFWDDVDRSRLPVPGNYCIRSCLRGLGLGLGLPLALVKYGGSMLWGTMVFFLVAIAASRRSRNSIALISAAIAVCLELFRLVHAPWLDAFRLTTAGALLLGRVFSPWNMLAYAVGIGLGVLLDRFAMSVFTKFEPKAQ